MDADEAQTPMLETPAPTYGAVPEAAPVARRPRKALVAALGGAGLLFAAVAVARAPSRETVKPSTSSFSMTPGVGIGAVEPARKRAVAQKSPGPKKNAYKEGLKTAEQRMAHYRKMVDELNAKAAASKKDEDVVAAMCDISSSPLVDWTVCDSFENAAPGGSLLAVEQAFFDQQGLKTHLDECAVSENTDFNWLRPCEWQAVAHMDAFCSDKFSPQVPELLPGVSLRPVKPDDDDACTKLTDSNVPAEDCRLCQANAFCSACGADNKYCNAFLKAHPDLLRSETNVGTAEAFFVDKELSYWCSSSVQDAIEQGTYDPHATYDVPTGAALYTGTYPESGKTDASKLAEAQKTHTTLPQRHAEAGKIETSRKNKQAKKVKIDQTPPNPDRHAITRRSPDAAWTGSRTATEQERLSAPVESDHKACTYNAQIDRESYVAIGGYDTVAYWSLPSTTDKMPDGSTPMPAPAVKGKSEYAVNHGGHVWYFANEENKQKFIESPNAYVPAFGGFCTWGIAYETWWGCVGNGVLVLPPADPNSWYIKDGKLYFLLFYGLWDWLETEPGGLDQSLAIASGRWRQCFGDIFETNFMFDGVISDLYQGTCEMRDGSAPLQKGDDDSALPY